MHRSERISCAQLSVIKKQIQLQVLLDRVEVLAREEGETPGKRVRPTAGWYQEQTSCACGLLAAEFVLNSERGFHKAEAFVAEGASKGVRLTHSCKRPRLNPDRRPDDPRHHSQPPEKKERAPTEAVSAWRSGGPVSQRRGKQDTRSYPVTTKTKMPP
jgi:hypothetical protein